MRGAPFFVVSVVMVAVAKYVPLNNGKYLLGEGFVVGNTYRHHEQPPHHDISPVTMAAGEMKRTKLLGQQTQCGGLPCILSKGGCYRDRAGNLLNDNISTKVYNIYKNVYYFIKDLWCIRRKIYTRVLNDP